MTQNEDGRVHFTYFDKPTQLSFIWDGFSDYIQVCHGGYGEPVVDMIRIPSTTHIAQDTPVGWVAWFRITCNNYIRMKGLA